MEGQGSYGAATKASGQTLEIGNRISILTFLYLASLVEGLDMQLLPASFRALERDLGLSPMRLAALAVCQGCMMAVSGPFWGCLADHGVPRRWILAGGTTAWGVLTFALACVSSFWAMVPLRLLNGAALGMLGPVAQSLIPDIADKAERGRFFGAQAGFQGIGQLLGALAGAVLSTMTIWGFRGWRVVFAAVGVLSLLLAGLTIMLMRERPRPWRLREASPWTELVALAGYWRVHTFKILVLQGIAGCIPMQALSFLVMYFQYTGLSNFNAAILSGVFMVALVVGHVLGGFIGDVLTWCSTYHGRAITAQISVGSGIPCVFAIFWLVPPQASSFIAYAVLLVALGVLSSWCHCGVNAPILSEVVGPHRRAAIMAWLSAISYGIASAVGAISVGYMAERFYGYKPSTLDVSEMPEDQREGNVSALANALTWTTVIPWSVCFVVYSFLHCTYPADLRAAQQAEGEETALE